MPFVATERIDGGRRDSNRQTQPDQSRTIAASAFFQTAEVRQSVTSGSSQDLRSGTRVPRRGVFVYACMHGRFSQESQTASKDCEVMRVKFDAGRLYDLLQNQAQMMLAVPAQGATWPPASPCGPQQCS